MKSITEFTQPTLQKLIQAKNTWLTEGKSTDEVATAIGESFKLEGDKLKFIIAAADLVTDMLKENKSFKRVIVASANEGEAVPEKYKKIEDNFYFVETFEVFKAPTSVAGTKAVAPRRGGGNNKGDSKTKMKTSPWGATPEEIASKKKAKN